MPSANQNPSEQDKTAAPVLPQDAAQPYKRLGEILVDEGFISAEQLQEALNKQKESGTFLGQVLVNLGMLHERELTSFLVKYCKIPYVSLLDYLVDESLLEYVPASVCLRHNLLPIDKLGSILTIAMVNPLDHGALESVRSECPGLRVKPILCDFSHYQQVASRLFAPKDGSTRRSVTAEGLGLRTAKQAQDRPEAPKKAASPPPQAKQSPAKDNKGQASASQASQQKAAPASKPSEPAKAPEKPAPRANPLMEEMVSFARESMRDTYAILERRIDLFHGLEPEQIAAIFGSGTTLEVQDGEVIFEKETESTELYVILAGSVHITDHGKILSTIQTGDMFGEMSLISGEPRSATAVAAETTSLFVLNEAIFQRLLTKHVAIRLLLNMLGALSQRLKEANIQIRDLL